MRALACADFAAVLTTHADQRAAEALATAFGRVGHLRRAPRWLVVCAPADKSSSRKEQTVLSLAQGVSCVTGDEASAWLRDHVRVGPHGAGQTTYLDAATLRKLEASEIEDGEFLAAAYAMYSRQARELVEEIFEGVLELDATSVKSNAHTLIAVSTSMGDLHTARAARALWCSSAPSEGLRAKAAPLRAAMEVGLRSLEMYLSADSVLA